MWHVMPGLLMNNARFSVLPPHLADNCAAVVDPHVASTFSGLVASLHLHGIMRLLLASFVYHYDYLLNKLPVMHSILSTSLFRGRLTVMQLQSIFKRS
jgi:hypothetical protein